MRLYVVRHAQSANNALLVPSLMNPDRDADPTLTEAGFKQAAALGKYVAEEFGEKAAALGRIKPWHAVKKLVVSPMRRCMLTATPISKQLGIPIRVKRDIHEHGGCFDGAADQPGGVIGRPGLSKPQLEAEFPGCVVPIELMKGWWSEEQGCETVAQAQERVQQVTKWLWEQADEVEGKRRRAHDRGARHVHRHPDQSFERDGVDHGKAKTGVLLAKRRHSRVGAQTGNGGKPGSERRGLADVQHRRPLALGHTHGWERRGAGRLLHERGVRVGF
jgi:broad specificity phosphatase PhoE